MMNSKIDFLINLYTKARLDDEKRALSHQKFSSSLLNKIISNLLIGMLVAARVA